jgi:hypothetical protein
MPFKNAQRGRTHGQLCCGRPNRHDTSIDHSQLQVGHFDGLVYNWLGSSINIDDGLDAAERLFDKIKELKFPTP